MKTPLEVINLYPAHDDTLAGAFATRQASRGSEPFLLVAGECLTWDEFAIQSAKLAAAFQARGIAKGDRVAIMARNHLGHVLTLFAAARLGAIMVPVNPDFGAQEARYVLSHAEVSGVIVAGETLPVVRQALRDTSLVPWMIRLDGSDHDAPSLQRVQQDAPSAAPPNLGAPDDTCVIVYTSGTTGLPKGVMHSQRSFVAAGEAYVERVHLQETDRPMIVLPLFHINALFYSVAGTLVAGASAVVVPRFSASTFWQTAAETGGTVTNIIEAIGAILQARPRSEYRADHRIRAVYGVRQNVAATFRDEFGIPHLFGGFGMTEIPGVTCNPFDGPNKPGSMGIIGRHPDPARPWAAVPHPRRCAPRRAGRRGRRARRQDADHHAGLFPRSRADQGRVPRRLVPDRRPGAARRRRILFLRLAQEGHHPPARREHRRRRARSGDRRASGRAARSRRSRCRRSSARTRSWSVVVRRAGCEIAAGDLAQWCRERLAPQKVPRYVCFIDAMPHTPTHKVAKEVLRKDRTLLARAIDLQRGAAVGAGR